MSLLARLGPFLSVLSHCQDSRKPFLGSFLRVSSLSQTVSERFRSLPLQTVSKVVELLQGLKAIDRGFHFSSAICPQLGVFSFVSTQVLDCNAQVKLHPYRVQLNFRSTYKPVNAFVHPASYGAQVRGALVIEQYACRVVVEKKKKIKLKHNEHRVGWAGSQQPRVRLGTP